MGGNSVKPFSACQVFCKMPRWHIFILHPEKLILTIETILANVRFGANNVFFTLGLEKVAELFVQNPEIFLDLAEKTKSYSSKPGNIFGSCGKTKEESIDSEGELLCLNLSKKGTGH